MGFPMWTLWGMGITAAGTLLMLLVAYIAQSPRLITRLGLAGLRLDLRARTFTGYALALLLLSLGFFLAGVPLDRQSENQVAEAPTDMPETNNDSDANAVDGAIVTAVPEEQTGSDRLDSSTARPASGAFAGLPPSAQTATAEILAAAGAQEVEVTPEAETAGTNQPTQTPSPTPTDTPLPSPTPSPTPTTTPTPTLTPTPIFEETAIINTGSSTVWIKRTPGGRDYFLVKGGDIMILFPGHANVGGSLWREVSTVDGVVGWVLESYLGGGSDLQNEGSG